MADEERIVFGRRGLKPPSLSPQPPISGPPSRLRSRAVIVGVAGVLMFGAYAAAEEVHQAFCPPSDPNNPNATASSCHSGPSSHFGGSWGHAGSSAHSASFGGFGGAGHGHGHGGG